MEWLANLLDKLPRFGKCCCWSLEFGSLFIAYFSLVLYIISAICNLAYLISGSEGVGAVLFKIIITVLLALFSLFLLLAVKKKNTSRLFMWLFISLLMVIVNIVALILSVIISFLGILSASVIEICWELFCILIINSFYREIEG